MRVIALVAPLLALLALLASQVESLANDMKDVKRLKIAFLETISQQDVDIGKAKALLSQIPLDPKAFHDYDDLEDPMNPVIANVSVMILHFLLNKFMLTTNAEEKAQYLEIMQLGMERGMNVAATYKDDPPLYLKAVMVKEMNLTVSMIDAAKKYMTQEIIARSRKMSKFLVMIYSLLAEVVPTAKLLLHVEKIAENASNRTIDGLKVQPSRKEIALMMLHTARLDKPAIKAAELLAFSPSYRELVDQITTAGQFSKSISLKKVIQSLDEYANKAICALIDAMNEDVRSGIALEHFFDLHVIPDENQRNAFHYLCMARSTVILESLLNAYKSDWEGDDANIRNVLAERIISSFEFADRRGHSPLSYCALRYGRRQHDDVGSKMVEFLDTLKDDLTDPAYSEHVEELKEALFEDPNDTLSVPLIIAEDSEQLRELQTSETLLDGSLDLQTPNQVNADDGGWNPKRLHVDKEQYAYFTDEKHCDIKQVYLDDATMPDQEEFFMEYLNSATPVIFRGAALNASTSRMFALRHVFRKDNFVKVYGGKKVTASTLPYGESFGVKSAGKTLRQVANADKVVAVGATKESDGTDVDAPLYTFVVPSNEWSSRITHDVPFPEPLTAVNPETGALGPAYSAQLQFYLGAAGTGAPIHYHGPAINSLAYGEKKWVLFPPDYSFYSTIPALNYFLGGAFETTHPMSLEEGITESDRKFLRGMQCTQHAGDIMFVPSLWGHATLNMKQSIGVAHEFSVETFIME